nr:MAG TPA: KilAC domain protein [Caudoviricetes sp.]
MQELIALNTVEFDGSEQQTVNARELHEFLENGDKFATWIVDRINQFGFLENQDFVTFSENSEKGRPRKEYALSLDMAKELCMVERNEKGKQARQYFIECERVAKQKLTAQPALPSYSEALRQLADQIDHNKELQEKIEQDKPKVEYCDQIVADNGSMTITKAAKVIGYPPRKFKDYIRQIGWLYANADTPMQHVITSGYMVLRYAHWTDNDGNYVEKPYAHITAKGMFALYKRMRKEGLIDRNERLELVA